MGEGLIFKEGGNFVARMEAKDGSMGFDFGGVYNVIKTNEYIEYTIADGRKGPGQFFRFWSSNQSC
jgi:uncharacterized protein YndB with AHSA1/START domain